MRGRIRYCFGIPKKSCRQTATGRDVKGQVAGEEAVQWPLPLQGGLRRNEAEGPPVAPRFVEQH